MFGAPMPTALVANLPYNVSVPVLLHLLEEFPSITRVLVMVQSEVADRLAAAPGSKVYGVPSVKTSFYGQVRRAGAVGQERILARAENRIRAGAHRPFPAVTVARRCEGLRVHAYRRCVCPAPQNPAGGTCGRVRGVVTR